MIVGFNKREGAAMFLSVEEDLNGRQRLYAHKLHGRTYHPIDHLSAVVLKNALLHATELVLADHWLVNPLRDGDVTDGHRRLSDILRRQHDVIRTARQELADLEAERRTLYDWRDQADARRREIDEAAAQSEADDESQGAD